MSQAPRYEYKTVKFRRGSAKDLGKTVAKHSRDGWELDHVDKKSVLAWGPSEHAILRRPIG